MTAWSYSSIKTFDQCPRKYYHLRVAKDVKDMGSTATVYGQEVHKAAEEFIRDGTPIPPKFKFIVDTLEALKKFEGEKHCEMKLGVAIGDNGFEPCEFFGKDVWWRGIVDLAIINGSKAYLVDYKTSKNAKYADVKQLDLMAGALFVHYPEIQTIKSGLAFVVSNEFIKKEHTRDNLDQYLSVFNNELDRLNTAEETDVWNAVSGPLCRFCPVIFCEHNRKE